MSSASNPPPPSRLRTLGWLIVLVGSGLLTVYGGVWYLRGPETALENIAERVPLAADEFRRETDSASAFDVITVVTRTQAVYGTALGLLALVVAWRGFRIGSRWAWAASWIPVAAVASIGIGFAMAGGAPAGILYLGFAVLVAVGLLMALPRWTTRAQQEAGL